MNPADYLDPTIALPFSKGLTKNSSFYGNLVLFKHGKPFPEINNGDIVIVGVPESRNSSNSSSSKAPDIIRKYLYGLASLSYKNRIVDAGNIKPTKSPADTYAALKDLVEFFIARKSRVVVLGGTQELTVPIYESLACSIKPVNLSVIDSRADFADNDAEFGSAGFLNKLIIKPPAELFDLSLIGYQGYLCNNKHLEQLSGKYHENLRLGVVRGNMLEVEPTLRDSDFVSFDLGAIRNSDCPGNYSPSPNGLYAEEACQLARLSGINERNSIFGLFEYCPDKDHDEQSAHLAAQIVWHYLDSSNQKKLSFSSHGKSDLKKFIINIGPAENEMVFYKSLLSDLWWVEIMATNKNFLTGSVVVSCSHNDYLLASKHEFPERWFRILKKIS